MAQEIVELNVGGVHYTTSRSTLCSVTNSMLARMFSGTVTPTHLRDKDGRYFIDRDGALFALVLTFLRSHNVCVSKQHTSDLVLGELEYFGLVPFGSFVVPAAWESKWSGTLWHSIFTQSKLLSRVFQKPHQVMRKQQQQLEPFQPPHIISDKQTLKKVKQILARCVMATSKLDGMQHVYLTHFFCLSRAHRCYTFELAVPTQLHAAFWHNLTDDTYTAVLSAWLKNRFNLAQCKVQFRKTISTYNWPDWIAASHHHRITQHNTNEPYSPPFVVDATYFIKQTLVKSCLSVTFVPPPPPLPKVVDTTTL